MDYEKVLDKLYTELPEKAKEKSRFEMPVFESFIQGTQTIITNFIDVTESLRRDPKHLMKFLSKECATAANIDKKRLVMKGKHRDRALNERLKGYINTYVLCRECKKPDTSIVAETGVQFIRCEACGARSPIPVIK